MLRSRTSAHSCPQNIKSKTKLRDLGNICIRELAASTCRELNMLQYRLTASAVAALASASLLVGCGNSTNADENTSRATTSADGTTSPRTTTGGAPSAPAKLSGLIVFTQTPGDPRKTGSCYAQSLTVGSIDPKTGVYQTQLEFASDDSDRVCLFPTPTDTNNMRFKMSPDGKYYAAQRTINNDVHTGWVDQKGTFTDVTAATLGDQGDFSASISQGPEFFDGQGNYYYRDFNTDEVRSVEIARPGTSRLVAAKQSQGLSPGEVPDRHGRFALPVSSCTRRADAWLDDSTYVFQRSDATMIFKSTANSDDCTGRNETLASPMLPKTDRVVGPPAASPTGEQIAFLSTKGSDTGLFVSDVAGTAPKKLALSGIEPTQFYLVDWR
jgi:hypothetical protein